MPTPAVQTLFKFDGGSGPATAAFASDNKVGNTIVVVAWMQTSAITAVSDSNNGSYGSAIITGNLGIQWFYAIFAIYHIKAGPNTVTQTVGSGECIFTAVELPPCSPVQVSNTATGTTGSPTVSLAHTVVNDFVVAFAGNTNSANASSPTIGSNTGFVVAPFVGDIFTFCGVSPGGTISVGVTGGTNWEIGAIALVPALNPVFANMT